MLVAAAGSSGAQIKLLDFGVAKIREESKRGVAAPIARGD